MDQIFVAFSEYLNFTKKKTILKNYIDNLVRYLSKIEEIIVFCE